MINQLGEKNGKKRPQALECNVNLPFTCVESKIPRVYQLEYFFFSQYLPLVLSNEMVDLCAQLRRFYSLASRGEPCCWLDQSTVSNLNYLKFKTHRSRVRWYGILILRKFPEVIFRKFRLPKWKIHAGMNHFQLFSISSLQTALCSFRVHMTFLRSNLCWCCAN